MAYEAVPVMLRYDGHMACFEGSAGSGKTSSCVTVAKKIGGFILPEYTETLDEQHRLKLMGSFKAGVGDGNVEIWRIAEERRYKLLKESCAALVLFDTSLVSVIAFECARMKFNSEGSLSPLIDVYREMLSQGQVSLPSKLVHLKVSEQVRQARLARRGACHPFLVRTDVSQYIDDIRREFFELYLPLDCWISIDTSNYTVDEITSLIETEINRLEAKPLTCAFDAWLASFQRHNQHVERL